MKKQDIDIRELDTIIDIDTIKERIESILREFNLKLIERKEVVALLILALYSKQNIFLVGEPGVSKTYMMKLLASLTGFRDYDVNLAEISSPKEMFGTLKQLSDTEYKSILNCEIGLLDEIFKARESGILNSLLNIMRDKKFTLEGKKLNLPLRMIIGASNEFPKGDELQAFDDRFGIRYFVRRIYDEKNFMSYWKENYDKSIEFRNKITTEEIDEVDSLIEYIDDSEAVDAFVQHFRTKVMEEKLSFSDRAFGDAKKILKVSALLNGRTELDVSDVFLFNHIGWRNKSGKERVFNIINEAIFGMPEEISKFLIDTVVEKNKIDNQIKGNISLALKYKHKVFNNDTFIAIRDNIIEVHNQYFELQKIINLLVNKRRLNKNVEKLIKNNIFIINYKDTAFKVAHVQQVRMIKKEIRIAMRALEEWLSKNENMVSYMQTVNEVLHKEFKQ